MKSKMFILNTTMRTSLTLLFIIFNILAITSLQIKTLSGLKQNTDLVNAKEEEKRQQSFLDVIQRFPSLGFSNIIADWAYLNFIQYFGNNAARNQIGYGLSPNFFQVIVNHDPNFINAYLLLDPATTLFAGEPTMSVEITTQGLKTLTPKVKDAYLVWIYKAINELLFLGEAKKAQKSYEMAAKWAFLQNDKTSRAIGKQAQEASQFLAKDPNSKQVQASAWLMVLSNAKDQKTVRLALAKIQALGGNVTIDKNRVVISFPSINKQN